MENTMIFKPVETCYTETQVNKLLSDCADEAVDWFKSEVDRRVAQKIHEKCVKRILARQRKRARIRTIATGIMSMFGCVLLPMVTATIFSVTELYTVELVFVPLGIYFLWDALNN